MEFRHVIIYSDDVRATVAFYTQVFGMCPAALPGTPPDHYVALDTGGTLLVIQSVALSERDVTRRFVRNDPQATPPGIELSFIVEDVEHSYNAALTAGALSLNPPRRSPWGQVFAHVRDLNGIIVSIVGQHAAAQPGGTRDVEHTDTSNIQTDCNLDAPMRLVRSRRGTRRL